MKKYKILCIFIVLFLILIITLNYLHVFDKKENDQKNQEEIEKFASDIQNELEKVSEELQDDNNLNLDDKLKELEEIVEDKEETRNEKLAKDILSQGTSSGSKYNGIPCNDICW